MISIAKREKYWLALAVICTVSGGAGAADKFLTKTTLAEKSGGIPGMTGALLPRKAVSEPKSTKDSTAETLPPLKPASIVRCLNPHEAAEMHSPKPEAPVVLKTVENLADAYSNGKFDGLSEYLDQDCAMFNEEKNETITGREAVLKRLKQDFKTDTAGGRTISGYTIDSPYVKVVGNTAVVTFRAEKLLQGQSVSKQQAFVTEMFVKVADQWKLAHLRAKWTDF
jgi:ketosteroid isomerase-like protein